MRIFKQSFPKWIQNQLSKRQELQSTGLNGGFKSHEALSWNQSKQRIQFFKENPEIDVVGSNISLIDNRGIEFGEINFPEEHEDIRLHFSYRNCIVHPSVMFRRKIIVSGNNYDVSLRMCEDLDLWLRLMNEGFKFANVQLPLILYRREVKYHRVRRNWQINLKVRIKHFSVWNLLSYVSVFIAVSQLALPHSLRAFLYKHLPAKKP